MKRTLVFCACAVLATASMLSLRLDAQEKADAQSHIIVRSSDLKWMPIIKGCDLTAVSGDSNADGAAFVLRIRCTAGTKIPAHWHPTDENVTVLKGIFQVGMGDTFNESNLVSMNVGNFASLPKEMRHFAFSKTDTLVQIHGVGPFKVNWVNPADVIPPDAPAGASAKPN